VRVSEGSELAGKSFADSAIREQAGVIVLAVKEAAGSMTFNPAPDALIRPGDTLIVIGGDAQLRKLESLAVATTLA
jgi:voltage-gated potassium channel